MPPGEVMPRQWSVSSPPDHGPELDDKDGRRPVYGSARKFQEDPHWRDLILFHEYFHGDNGAGLGASYQTGWTGMIARGMHLFATSDAEEVLQLGKMAFVHETEKPPGRQRVPAGANDGNEPVH
jgi:hypothetical protein